jgi:hypothetical protein
MMITKQQALNAKVNGLYKANSVKEDPWSGLTKREHFAGMAMQALVTKGVGSYESTGRIAVEYADALLEALEEDNEVKD